MTDDEDETEWLAERVAIVWEGGRVPWERAVEIAQERLRLRQQRGNRTNTERERVTVAEMGTAWESGNRWDRHTRD